MNKLVLHSIFLFTLYSWQTVSSQTVSNANLTGQWAGSDKTSSLELTLYQTGDEITGVYCAIAQNGNRIDCSDTEPSLCMLYGKLIENSAKIAFASCYSNMIDTATIIYNPKRKTLQWQWTQTSPDTYAPVPMQATLTRGTTNVAPMPDLLRTAQTVIGIIKTRNFGTLSNYFHPTAGIRFSPYAYIDTLSDRVFSSVEFAEAVEQGKKITWGAYEGSGSPIKMIVQTYFDEFIYNADFTHATKKSINKEIGISATVSNITEIYPEDDFIEYCLQKTDENNEVSNWKSLRLVFKLDNNRYYLTGIIHDHVN